MIILAQILGFLAEVAWLTSVQQKNKKQILICQTVANALFALQYYFLGALTAAVMSLTAFLRSSVFYYDSKKDNHTSVYSLIFFLISIIILGALTYTGLFNLIPIVVTLSYSYAIWQKNLQFSRIVFILVGLTWIYYNYRVGAYTVMVGNVFEVASGVIALIRFKKK